MIPGDLPGQVAELYRLIAEMERRNRNRRRPGTVAELDHDKGQYRVKLSEQDGKPFLTGWIKTRQVAAGNVKIDALLTEGEPVDVVSENGDMTDAMIDTSAYSTDHPRANKDTPLLITVGDAKIALTGNGMTFLAGTITIKGNLVIEGSSVTHNGHSIGDDHKHKDVDPGGGISGVPV